jgi:hypothetical protein
VRIKINAPECPLSRFYSDLGLLPWSKTGDFGEKRAKPDSLLALWLPYPIFRGWLVLPGVVTVGDLAACLGKGMSGEP